MDTLEALENYMEYMQRLGFGGLALDHNPFVVKPKAPVVKMPSVLPRHGPLQPAAPTPPFPTPAKNTPSRPAARPAPGKSSDLLSLMGMVNSHQTTPVEDNRLKAEQVVGQTQDEKLRNLYGTFQACQACALGTTRTHFVFGEGPSDANLMFVGEGPGHNEDRTGRPFVGKAGDLLTKIIQAMGLRRDEVFITNVVKCRPPENRAPLPDEIATCGPILTKQVKTVNPSIIVVLGATALRYFKEPGASIMRMRGQFFTWEEYTVMPTFHPAYILRNPQSKREVWADIQQVMARLREA